MMERIGGKVIKFGHYAVVGLALVVTVSARSVSAVHARISRAFSVRRSASTSAVSMPSRRTARPRVAPALVVQETAAVRRLWTRVFESA